ncbi:MAG: response regulator transcription factor [Bacteroides sp.]|nr:response regulator transcription factor [Bacteroides sp.]MCM1413748.1 response regulator transcription factor [Bacteroides sp.]MCM1472233.1 response regulator transcription factor [Bacteroides sp.]
MSAPEQKNKPTKGKLLIVDTDTLSSELLQLRFETEGYQSDILTDGRAAFDRDLTVYNLILVDLMNQPFDGLKFTRSIKINDEFFNIPVIIVSAVDEEDKIVAGFDAGADDYIIKPFSTRELIARVNSIIRRQSLRSIKRSNKLLEYEGLKLDLTAGSVSADGAQLSLSRIEFVILAMFMRNRNSFFDRSEIRHEAWEDDSEISDRAVDTNISRLRKKIGTYGRHIVNRQGFGYGFID